MRQDAQMAGLCGGKLTKPGVWRSIRLHHQHQGRSKAFLVFLEEGKELGEAEPQRLYPVIHH